MPGSIMVAYMADHIVGDNVADSWYISIFLCDAAPAGCMCACAQRYMRHTSRMDSMVRKDWSQYKKHECCLL